VTWWRSFAMRKHPGNSHLPVTAIPINPPKYLCTGPFGLCTGVKKISTH